MKEHIIHVKGMSCSGCERRIINALSQMPEIKKVTADHRTGKVVIEAENLNEKNIEDSLDNLGFEVIK